MNKLLPAAVAAMSLGAYAAETNETETAELPPVVVEASRIGKTPNEIPSAVQVITRGEIAADGETIEIRPFGGEPQVIVPAQHGNHGGGDREIMSAFARLVATASPARYAGFLETALVSHRLAFRAEEERKRHDD